MAPEYGATIGLFPVDNITLDYLVQTGRTHEKINLVSHYLKAIGLFKDYKNDPDLHYSSVLELDLSTVKPCVAGPKRPHDFVKLSDLKNDWNSSLTNQVGFKGFGLSPNNTTDSVKFQFNGE